MNGFSYTNQVRKKFALFGVLASIFFIFIGIFIGIANEILRLYIPENFSPAIILFGFVLFSMSIFLWSAIRLDIFPEPDFKKGNNAESSDLFLRIKNLENFMESTKNSIKSEIVGSIEDFTEESLRLNLFNAIRRDISEKYEENIFYSNGIEIIQKDLFERIVNMRKQIDRQIIFASQTLIW